jgi:hypothetical protein
MARVNRRVGGSVNHGVVIIALATVVCWPSHAGAQEWTEFVDRTERFSVNFPGQPTVRDTTYQPQRGGEITFDAFSQVDRIDGHQLQITNRDKTVTIVGIYVHARRLYILEATVPPGTPGAVHFQQSLIILDEDGKRIRYELDNDGHRTGRVTNLDGIC